MLDSILVLKAGFARIRLFFVRYGISPFFIRLHSTKGNDDADGKKYAGDNAACTEEDHFVFDTGHDAGLLCHMEVGHQGL